MVAPPGGFTSGADSNHWGTAAKLLTLNVDGFGQQNIDVSGAQTLGQVASLINTQLAVPTTATTNPGYDVNYAGIADASTGSTRLPVALATVSMASTSMGLAMATAILSLEAATGSSL